MLAIGGCFEILVAITTYRHDHPDCAAVDQDVETPFVTLNPRYGILLRKSPAGSVPVNAADEENPLVGVGSVALVNALNLNLLCHPVLS